MLCSLSLRPRVTDLVRALGPTLLGCALGATAVAPVSAASQERGRDPEEVFARLKQRFDKNFDGVISAEEWTRNRRNFRRLDADGDGKITLADLKARMGGGRPEMAPAASGDSAPGEFSLEALEFFETRVRPVLATHCYSCHSEDAARIKGGLRVDGRSHLISGGVGGPALVPGDADASALIEAVRYEDPLFAMPPREKLSDEEIRDLESWVAMGAPWPAAPETNSAADVVVEDTAGGSAGYGEIDLEAGREFWSFQPVSRPAVPSPADEGGWARSPIDRFLLEEMEDAGTRPVADADDATWLRRVTFDLTGLPPSPEELAAFQEDEGADRHARVVDRLLTSPGFGERFGRHWLDVARYGESSGKETNVVYPHAWRYRDWVIDAFDGDMPYDEFLTRQLAGDLLEAEDDEERAWNLIATGYLALGPKSHQTRDQRQFRLDMIDEQVDAVSQGMLGLTLSCARCHDHKFDPLPTEDYYAFAGFFMSTETLFGTYRGAGNNNTARLIELPEATSVPNGPRMEDAVRRIMGRALDNTMGPSAREMNAEDERQARRLAQRREQQSEVIRSLLDRFDDRGRALPANRLAMGVCDGEPIDLAVLDRGELERPRGVAPRGVPQVLAEEPLQLGDGSGRLDLARWIASAENPLTARVWVNRVWHHLFGAGLVTSPDNFGQGGDAPTHPELLDWLAAGFVENGWSTKALVREIVMSRAYRLDSARDRGNEALDPEITTLWRMRERRLEAEAIRDAMLVASGELSPERPVGSPTNAMEGRLQREEFANFATRERPVRSIYMPALRGHVTDAMEAFDAPDSAFVTGAREVTTGATQALFLMNDGDVLGRSDALADRVLAMELTDRERVDAAFVLTLGREPLGRERSAVLSFLRDYERTFDAEAKKAASSAPPEDPRDAQRRLRRQRRQRERAPLAQRGPEEHTDGRRAAWSAFAQSLFQSAEFRAIG